MMNPKVFGIASLVFLFAISHAYSFFQFHFSGLDQLKDEVVDLRSQVQREKLKTAVAQNELQDFQQNVALLLPSEKLKSSYPLRNLASVVGRDAFQEIPIDFAQSTFKRAKNHFIGGKYEESNKLFAKVIQDYPASTYVVESNFLLVEGLFKSRDYNSCLTQIDSMITLFPDNDLSGFAMLRLGSIFQMRDHVEEAVEVYQSVLKQFPENELLTKQARLLLSQVEL